MGQFHDCALDVRVPAHVKVNALALHVLKLSVKKVFAPILCTQTFRLLTGLEYLGSLRTDLNADVTEGPVFDFRGTTCRYFEKTFTKLNTNTVVIFTEPLHVDNIAFPNVHDIHGTRIARKSLSNRAI